jgi:UDP-N-acetylglucosamine transferase subunit ALG13/glycosyltransferase involved in cell wall biosynthesis
VNGPSYAVVTAVRDDAGNLASLAQTLLSQTSRPTAWVIVDDDSQDATSNIARELADEWGWIKVETVRSGAARGRGSRIGELLSLGATLIPSPHPLVAIVDADVTFGPRYFENLIERFAANPRLGIASGAREERVAGAWRLRYLTSVYVEAQCRVYRGACLGALLPFERHAGWDGVDVIRARVLGWQTEVFRDLRFRHHRPIGARDGSRLRAWSNEGRAAWAMRYRPSYLLLRSVYRSKEDVRAFAMLAGFVTGWLRRDPRSADPRVAMFLRSEQRLRHIRQRQRELSGTQPRRSGRPLVDVLLTADPGGHLAELWALRDAWSGLRSGWLTLDSEQSRSLLRSERALHHGRGPTTRSTTSLLWNLAYTYRVLRQLRPKVLVACGSGLPVPAAWAARVAGVPVVFIECGGRIDRPSLSFRLIAPVSDRLYVQSAAMSDAHPRARYAGRISWNRALSGSCIEGGPIGTFVTVGTSVKYPFDRLLRALEALPLPRPVVVQHGISAPDQSWDRAFSFASPVEIERCVRTAEVVISHAGIGSVMTAVALGKCPIVMPRSASHGESVDDHQRAFARDMAAAGQATLIDDKAGLRRALETHRKRPRTITAPREPSLADDLSLYLADVAHSAKHAQH